MLNTIAYYFLIGVCFGIFVEILATIGRKHGHQIEHLNNVDRVLIVAFWPVAFIVWFRAYWNAINKK